MKGNVAQQNYEDGGAEDTFKKTSLATFVLGNWKLVIETLSLGNEKMRFHTNGIGMETMSNSKLYMT